MSDQSPAASERVVIGFLYATAWDGRGRAALEADLDALKALDPRIEVFEAAYVDPDDLRTKRGAAPQADFRALAPSLTAEQREAFARAEIVVALDLPYDMGTVAPRLRWVQGMGAGVSQLTSAGLADAGIRLTSAAGANAASISEFVIARLLQLWKRLPEIDAFAAEHRWQPTFGVEIAGLTLGIVGFGAIGRQVAQRAAALGLNVIACRRSGGAGVKDPDAQEVYGPDGLLDVAARSDAIVAAVPETADTVDLFDETFFASMRPGALFVNVGRGSAVVEDALADALRSGKLGGAAIDVVRDEPLGADSALWDVPGLLISPHSATSPNSFWANLQVLFRDNVQRYLNGEPLRNEVDARAGS